MDILNGLMFVFAAIGAIGVLLWLVSAVRGRQFSKPRFKITIARPSSHGDPRAMRKYPFTTLLIGSKSSVRPNIVGIPIFLKNTSDMPIMDLSLRIEYSNQHHVGNTLYLPDKMKALNIEPNPMAKREYIILFKTAHVSWDLGMLRPHDTYVVSEFLSLHPLACSVNSTDKYADSRIATASKRFAGQDGFQAFFVLDVVARSSNCAPIATSMNIIWSKADSMTALVNQIDGYVSRAWNGKKPEPGIYFDPAKSLRMLLPRSFIDRWMKRTEILSEEKIFFMFLDDEYDLSNSTPQKLGERLLNASTGSVVIYAPPWGLTGEEYDLEAWRIKQAK